jgi:hypothetical protein
MSFINQGIALVTTGLKVSSAINKITNGLSQGIIPDLGKTSDKQGQSVKGLPNELEQFASYTPLWTLACLTPAQFNDPLAYRGSPAALKNIVFSSAGRYDSQRTATASGTPEYFVNNFLMTTIVTASQKTGNTNAISFSFDIYEPYSMGLFLQSLQIAALNAGHSTYLEAPYVLRLDFAGYTDDGKLFQGVRPRYFTVKLTKVEFDVTESGSNYKVEAIPFNHQGYGSVINKTYNDIAIEADKNKPVTVKQLLVEGENSLCAVLNRAEQDLVLDEKQLIANVYEIQFPQTSDELFNTGSSGSVNGATINPSSLGRRSVGGATSSENNFGENPISESDMGLDAGDGGNFTFKKETDVIDETTGKVQRDKMTVDPKNRKFQFAQGETITAIIHKIVIASNYAVKSLSKPPSPEGLIDWFKIDAQIQLLGFDDKRGEYAKKIIFRVYPYKVHQAVFSNPTSAPPGYGQLEKLIAKKYEYIYSGQNNDILRFDIKINNLFFTGATPKSEKDSSTNANVDQKSSGEKTGKTTKTEVGAAASAALASNTGSARLLKDPGLLNVDGSPSGNETTEQMVAKTFQKAFLDNTTELVNVDLEVLGDPYWLVDSGIGNYFASVSADNKLTTADNTMNYEGSDVYIYVSFKSPTDVNERTGLYDFPNNNQESVFSGIYKVITVDNTFNDGVFKQKLACLRMPLQASDFDNTRQPVDVNNTPAIIIGEEAPPKTTVTDPEELYGPF